MKTIVLLFIIIAIATCFKSDPVIEDKYSVKILQPGQDDVYPYRGQEVTIHYVGRFPDTKKEFKRSEPNEPYSFEAGSGPLRCWNELTLRMSVGEKINVVCPSIYAHGAQGYRDIVPPHQDVEYDLELVKISTKKKNRK